MEFQDSLQAQQVFLAGLQSLQLCKQVWLLEVEAGKISVIYADVQSSLLLGYDPKWEISSIPKHLETEG